MPFVTTANEYALKSFAFRLNEILTSFFAHLKTKKGPPVNDLLTTFVSIAKYDKEVHINRIKNFTITNQEYDKGKVLSILKNFKYVNENKAIFAYSFAEDLAKKTLKGEELNSFWSYVKSSILENSIEHLKIPHMTYNKKGESLLKVLIEYYFPSSLKFSIQKPEASSFKAPSLKTSHQIKKKGKTKK